MSTLYDNLENMVNAVVYDRFFGYGSDAIATATGFIQNLASYTFTPTPTSVEFNVHGGAGTFVPPEKPTRTIGELTVPEDVPDVDIETVTLDTVSEPAPTAPSTYTFAMPAGQPGALDVDRPGDAPTVADVTLPATRTFTLPDAPTPYDIDIPTFDGLTLPEFTATAPVIDFDVPPETFGFTEQDYVSDLLDRVKARVDTMLDGGTGLPAAIEQALFDRARSREDVNALRAVQEATEEFASRGWSEPTGTLSKRLREVRQNNQNQSNALSRDIEIENKKIEIENLRFAVTQGIVIEQALLGAHLAIEQRRFEVAKYTFDAAVNVFNARVALHNASVRAYEAEATVFRQRMEGEIAKVQAFKAEVEAQAVIGDLNRTLAQTYESQVRGVMAEIEAYKAEFQAALAPLEVSRAQLEAFRLQVQSYGEQVRGYGAEWEAYNSKVRAELGRAQGADIAAKVFATRVSAWDTKWKVAFERQRGEIATEELKYRKFAALLQQWQARLEGEKAQLDAQVRALAAESQLYSAGAQVAQAASASHDRSFQLELERGRAQAQLLLQNGEINLRAALQADGYRLQAMQSATQASSQLAASALSAINVSGSLSGSLSNSQSIKYSGTI